MKIFVLLMILAFNIDNTFAACKEQENVLPGKIHLSVYSRPKFLHTILLIPPTGGETFLDRDLAKNLCKRGARTIIIQSWDGDSEPMQVLDLKRHDRLTQRALSVFDQVIDWSGSQKVGVVGASLGGMLASFLTSSDDRVAAAVFVVAGGPISEVIAFGDQDHLNTLRQGRSKHFGYANNHEYEQALHRALDWDTVRLARPEMRDKISVIIGGADTTVPSEQQWRLYHAWGSPRSLKVFPNNHIFSILRAFKWNKDWIAHQLFSRLEKQ